MELGIIITVVLLIVSCIFFVYSVKKLNNAKKERESLKDKENQIEFERKKAKQEYDSLLKQANIEIKEKEIALKESNEKEISRRRQELAMQEKRLFQKEEVLEKKEDKLYQESEKLHNAEKQLDIRERELSNLEEKQVALLEEISHCTQEEAKEELLSLFEKKVVCQKANILKKYEEETKMNAKKVARQIITSAIQMCVADHTSEATVSVVNIPSDEIKGMIIGREGRNIRTLETLTGVQFIIDDTPEAITISSFDPIRREVAKQTLEKLIQDGRIQPAKIEEMVEKTVHEIEEIVLEAGKNASEEAGVLDLTNEELSLLGKLKFRTSYGQNVLSHSVEVASLCAIMAKQVGADPYIAARAGLLHDIGKAIDHDPEIQGTHVEIGVDICKRNGEKDIIVNAVQAHHGDVEPESIEAVLVMVADTISASRPGARRDTFEAYIKRLEALESIAQSFDGVEKAYALSAGREIRIILNPEKISDDEMKILAFEVAQRIENEVPFPGNIKVNVIREKRTTEYAKNSKVTR